MFLCSSLNNKPSGRLFYEKIIIWATVKSIFNISVFLFSSIYTTNNNNKNDIDNIKLNKSSSNKPFHLAMNNIVILSLFCFGMVDTVDCLIMMMMIISHRIIVFRCFFETNCAWTKYQIKKPQCRKFYYISLYTNQPLNWFIVVFCRRR